MDNIYNKIIESINNNISSWLVTVTNVTGSTPASVGMKMLVYSDGSIEGTVGGGEIEKKVIDKIVSTQPGDIEKWSYNLGTKDDSAESTNMVCGGIQDVLVEPLLQGSPLYIIGGGHCGMALSNLASKTGFLVTVIDNRTEWANKTKHPNAVNTIYCDYSEVSKNITFSKNIYIAIMTHGHIHDALVLEQLISKDYKYLGMIGSKKKVKIVLKDLVKKGISSEKVKSVFSPIGLDILTHKPDEIAVSIVAQMIAVKNEKAKITYNQNPLL
ncbi:MAG: XdhC/CoxI family protein [Ignavibacteriae bacterium]|nr:XdhC/CoxI family protein [Ignavibacteriota bacterium]